MIRLTKNDWRIFRRLQRKHKVSTEFLRYNLVNIEKFIWFETWPRIVIKRYAVRKQNRVFITYYRLRRVLFDQSNRKMFKKKRQNIKQWSKRLVAWQRHHLGVKEYVEEFFPEEAEKTLPATDTPCNTTEDVSKQLKEQLELLKNARRPQALIRNSEPKVKPLVEDSDNQSGSNDKHESVHPSGSQEEKQKSDENSVDDVRRKLREQLNSIKARRDNTAPLDIIRTPVSSTVIDKPNDNSSTLETQGDWQSNLESTPEKQITTQENLQPVKQLDSDEKTEKCQTETNTQSTERLKTGLNFIDMLMCKVCGSGSTNSSNTPAPKSKDNLSRISSSSSLKEGYQHHQEHSMDSTDSTEFLGFDDCERIPGMLMTPIVPNSTKNNKNSVFVSESLNEYMRINDLETNYNIDEDKSVTKSKIYARDMEGLMTPKTVPPHFDMPAVPENLLKFRTVAERKHYLQKFSKNHRLAIINNEASIYRELQRRMRTQKVKSASQTLAQSSNSSMSFTRNGWNAASFINTEFNKYYYQVLDVDFGSHVIRLRGTRGNNDEFHKPPYISHITKPPKECPEHCADDTVWQCLKPIKTIEAKTKKLNKDPLPAVFKPCPLSHKTFQKPLDDDTAALLLAGGSMAVVRMPTVELEVFPEYGKPLHEIAKRYLQYILPHHDISREWAEFSVSTLQQPKTLKEAEEAVAKGSTNARELRKSFTFVIPYLNDRNHILVRRVVDRSEKLDESFEQCLKEDQELVPKTDFSFRQNLDQLDDVLMSCADVVSDMINTVAISCSENSFIKPDPHGLNIDKAFNSTTVLNKQETNGLERQTSPSPNNFAVGGNMKKQHKKQNSLLLELKRLNATIIDAAVKPGNDKKPCSKEYCQMGCICVSLEEVAPMREHCGKTKCMFECTCKSNNQARIMRLETEGRTLTTEDAFMLRRKATARLARMEKEFTSTIVLTENETLLINETNNDKKRRCTKAPKRYEDFTDTEDEQRKTSPKKTALTTIDNEKHLAIEIKEIHEPVYVQDSILEQLKHCTVNLVPLKNMDNVAVWCMVHNLYKCFCKGRATEGKPMVIEKEEANKTIEHNAEQKLEYDYTVSAKPKYTFEKVEQKKKKRHNDEDDDDDGLDPENKADYDEEDDKDDGDDDDSDDNWIRAKKRRKRDTKEKLEEKRVEKLVLKQVEELKTNSEPSNSDDDNEDNREDTYSRASPTEESVPEKQKSKRSLHDVRKRFFQSRNDSCRRHIPTPRRMFLYCNRRRRLSVLKYIKENENEQTRLLLNEHVLRSVYYHKTDIENHKKDESTISAKDKNISKDKTNSEELNTAQVPTVIAKKKVQLDDEVVDLIEDDDEPTISMNSLPKDKDENTQLTSSSTKSCSEFEKIIPDMDSSESANHFQICSSGGVITVKKFATLTDLKNTDGTNKPMPSPCAIEVPKEPIAETVDTFLNEELKLPKISSCFSLNVNANTPNCPSSSSSAAALRNEKQCLDFSFATTPNSAAFSQTESQQVSNTPNNTPLMGSSTSKNADSLNYVLDMENESVRDIYNSVIRNMNSLVSKKMQDIDCALQRESHIIPTPNPDILCIMKWCNFLDAFCEGFSYVWQVKMKDDTFFAITIQNMMPLIPGAMGIVNITALKPDKMPLMGKMLLQKFRNKETEKLAMVMQGKQSHWVVKGFLKSDPNMACNKPTPDTHPSLTKKINVLCSLLVKQRQRDEKKKEKSSQWVSPQMKTATQTLTRTATMTQVSQQSVPQVTPKIAQILPTRRLTTVQPTPPRTVIKIQPNLNPPPIKHPTLVSQLQQTKTPPFTPEIRTQNVVDPIQKPAKTNEIESGKIIAKISSRKYKSDLAQSSSLLKMDTYSKMSSNIEFRSVTQHDINEIFLPELHKLDHKWLVLDLHNDFSHIFVPDFRDLVSLDRIQKVINFARQKSKIVKLQFFQNAPFDAFVTPKSGRKIYFGPLTPEMKPPTLILLQSVDGQMMLRELYQLQHNIVKKPEEKTKAFWLIHLKGQTRFEMDVNSMEKGRINNAMTTSSTAVCLTTSGNNKEVVEASESSLTNILNKDGQKNIGDANDENDDDDCMIIDDEEENTEGFTNESSTINQTTITLIPKTNALNNSSAPTTIMTSQSINNDPPMVNTTTQSFLRGVPNSSTIIKPISCSNVKPSSPIVVNVPQQLPACNKTLPILTLPPNTVITGITPSPTATNLTPTTIFNLPSNAVITGITPAPPEASYSSTIFVTPSSSSLSSTTANITITSTAQTTFEPATIISSSSKTSETSTQDLTSSQNKNTSGTIRQALESAAIKRRRISLFCPNNYDKLSENIAVDAVLNKILPDAAKDIQINPLKPPEENKTPQRTSEVVATVGVTKISKLPVNEVNTLPSSKENPLNSVQPLPKSQSKAPIVFDVNFMDDGDEPTASIVIKPSTSTNTTSNSTTTAPLMSTSQIQNVKPIITKAKVTNVTKINSSGLATSVVTSPAYKTIKLPTLSSSITGVTGSCTDTISTSTKAQLINSLLCTKQGNLVTKLSTFRAIAPKVATSNNSPATPSANTYNPVTTTTTIGKAPVTTTTTIGKAPVTLKVQRIISSSLATAAANTPVVAEAAKTKLSASPAILTVQQVQNMLSMQSVTKTMASNSPTTSTAIQNIPIIKNTIRPANITVMSNALNTPGSTPSSLPADPSSSTTKPINSISTTSSFETTNSLNSNLTITKVQSFGSPPKPQQQSDKQQQQQQTPIVINDVKSTATVQTPPAHIQYGYIVSASHVNHKFVAKRVADEFYVKVPSVGILKLQGLAAVNNYLNNKYINKNSKETHNTVAAVWQFAAASKAVQMQNHQKSLLVRKSKSPAAKNVTPTNRMTAGDNSLDEPILIDD